VGLRGRYRVPAHNKGLKDGNRSAATASSLWASLHTIRIHGWEQLCSHGLQLVGLSAHNKEFKDGKSFACGSCGSGSPKEG